MGLKGQPVWSKKSYGGGRFSFVRGGETRGRELNKLKNRNEAGKWKKGHHPGQEERAAKGFGEERE